MGYLKEFQTQIANRDFSKFVQLWEEYCTCDTIDIEEVVSLLQAIKVSDFAKPFGAYTESLLPTWQTIQDKEDSYRVLRLLFDLQSTHSPKLADIALEALSSRYGKDSLTPERLKLIGLRTKDQFQSALSNFDLLVHINKGNFVYHPSGWGAGEILDFSMIREQLAVEFENVSGVKQITIINAFKTLVPLSSDHFLAKRFKDPDLFEKEAKENPIAVMKCLLRDLGPKNAAEIKDELEELVIPEKDWARWWQNTRAKMKKDTEIESPDNLKEPFVLRKQAVSHEDQFVTSLGEKKRPKEILTHCYNFIRDYSGKIKQEAIKNSIINALTPLLDLEGVSLAEKLSIYFSLASIGESEKKELVSKIITESENLKDLVLDIEIVAYKKLALQEIKRLRADWKEQFIELLYALQLGLLRDYIVKELQEGGGEALLKKSMEELIETPWKDPDLFLWFFGKLMEEKNSHLPFEDKEGQNLFAESFLILLSRIENNQEYKDTVKKMYLTLSNQRYALIRKIFEGSSLEFVKEFNLLATKCHTISDHDLKIFKSLAEVVHPAIHGKVQSKKRHYLDPNTIWTTEEGYRKTEARIKQIGTKEVVENAKEIEAARALGDLRENSEYKSAQEKRARLQSELKSLSEQLGKARVITPQDIIEGEVSVGTIVEVEDGNGRRQKYSILGPWEANPDGNILSFQSKLAQSMLGLSVDDTFQFKDEEWKIISISSVFGANS